MTVAGSLIQVARIKCRMSQRELAEKAGTSPAAIAMYEAGRREPSVPTLMRILDAAGFDLRMHLAVHDNHDEVLERWTKGLPANVRSALPRRRRAIARQLRSSAR